MQIEAFINENKNKLKVLATFVLVFVLGFASGYYYLDGNKTPDVLSIKEGSDDCAALFKQNTALSASDIAREAVADKPAEAVSGAVLGANTAAAVSNPVPGEKAFAGSKNSTLYHTRTCQYVKRIKAENLVWFASQKEAEAAGRKPHSCAGE